MTARSHLRRTRAPLGIAVPLLMIAVRTIPASAQSYHTYPQIESALAQAESNYPSICRRVSLGTTVQGRTLWALCISDNVMVQEDEPEFRYVSTMHGNEIIGVEMCLNLIDYLTINYGSNPRVTNIVNSIETWIVPCMNPDGFVAGTRGNAHGVDLNRNFPDPYTSPSNTTTGREPETAAIMNWAFGQSFTLAANFHSGALVVNYPFDANASGSSVNTPSPDDDLFRYISEQYSQFNLPMWNSPSFYHGITNGADWYVVYGGMQDWSYVYMGCNEVTIEIANSTPPASQIPTWWNDNRESMLAYLETSLIGVRGIVTSQDTGLPLPALINVIGRDHTIYADPDVGDYHRMLLPGAYDLRFDAPGHDPRLHAGVAVSTGAATRLDTELPRPAIVLSPNGGESLPVGIATTVSWTGSASAQFHVQYTLNHGSVASINDGFEAVVLDPAYSTGGNAPWLTATGTVHSGSRAARAGTISHNQQSWMSRTLTGPGSAGFWYKVSSETNYDFFTFYLDGAQQVRRSGTVDWTYYPVALSAGAHTLKWEYTKDGSVNSGSDTAWIDDAQYVTDGTVWTDVVALTLPGATSQSWAPPAESASAKVRLRAYYGGGLYGQWDESNGVFSIVPQPPQGDLNCDGAANAGDIAPMALALVDPAGYAAAYPACDILRGDMQPDGAVNGLDLEPFISMIWP